MINDHLKVYFPLFPGVQTQIWFWPQLLMTFHYQWSPVGSSGWGKDEEDQMAVNVRARGERPGDV